MDETGFLEEGQIFCRIASDKGHTAITGDVAVTRSPALHPGDIQLVKAVEVPKDHPLMCLHNVMVFSSKGVRVCPLYHYHVPRFLTAAKDLPSQLSGGDLDGDLYNVIYDPFLTPKFTYEPADYHAPNPVDIGRPVEKSDMTDHLISFMENDCLGQIANLHQILADQAEQGTLDADCIKLAELHSDAVDFSKTGIPVSTRHLRRVRKYLMTIG